MAGVQLESLEQCLEDYLPEEQLCQVKKILYGRSDDNVLDIPETAMCIASLCNFEIKAYRFDAKPEELREPHVVRVAAIQNSIVLPTSASVEQQRQKIYEKVTTILSAAALAAVNIVCLQEAWTMPFAFCTCDKLPWCEFAEDAETGETTQRLQGIAQRYNMVIISPILERDTRDDGVLWNTAVVISNRGEYLGKHRKNHIPRVGDFHESTYYMEGNTGHPVFETDFGRIAINICYGRHHPQNWMMFGLNGADIVFNPSATVEGLSEPLWGVEGRNAAIANSYFTVSINRVGTERFNKDAGEGGDAKVEKIFGPFYGSSYIAAPDGSRTRGLSRTKDGLLIAEMDLNLCRQVKDFWGFRMTQRLPLYAAALQRAADLNYQPQIVKEEIKKDGS